MLAKEVRYPTFAYGEALDVPGHILVQQITLYRPNLYILAVALG